MEYPYVIVPCRAYFFYLRDAAYKKLIVYFFLQNSAVLTENIAYIIILIEIDGAKDFMNERAGRDCL